MLTIQVRTLRAGISVSFADISSSDRWRSEPTLRNTGAEIGAEREISAEETEKRMLWSENISIKENILATYY